MEMCIYCIDLMLIKLSKNLTKAKLRQISGLIIRCFGVFWDALKIAYPEV
jgi:hypothetical protein